MIRKQATQPTWSIILAGGDGERLRPWVERWMGYPLPKQYCTFVGTRSMLQHTWDRADRLTVSERKVTVIARDHYQQACSHLEQQSVGQVVLQPQNRDTAAGIFLPLTYIRSWDPDATVVIFPSDHFVFPEDRFLETVRGTISTVEILKDRIILLGVRPTGLELDYGWIEMGSILGWSAGSSVRQANAFLEKPDAIQGLAAMAGGALWNTLVMTAKVETLWRRGWQCMPELMEHFEKLEEVIDTPREGPILDTIYREMPCRNFSSDLLQRVPDCVGVMELQDVLWSDWGRPERIEETLRLLGKDPAFPIEHFREPHRSQDHEHVMEVSL